MNFYQRANLSMGLAVILGLELAVSQWLQLTKLDESFQFTSLTDEIVWISFQFLFRIKVIIDDHRHFEKPNGGEDTRSAVILLWDFLLFASSGFLHVLAAVFSFKFGLSAIFFIAGLAIGTVWAAVHLVGAPFVGAWIVLNICYSGVIFAIWSGWPESYPWLPHVALLGLLIADFVVSKTASNMPKR